MMSLQRLTRARYHRMEALVRESNFLMTNLYLKFSDYTLAFNHNSRQRRWRSWKNSTL